MSWTSADAPRIPRTAAPSWNWVRLAAWTAAIGFCVATWALVALAIAVLL
jgi:hypothetical protein